MIHDYNRNFVSDNSNHCLILNWANIDMEMLNKFLDAFILSYKNYVWNSHTRINLEDIINNQIKKWVFPGVYEKQELTRFFWYWDFSKILWSTLTVVFKIRERKNDRLFLDKCSAIFNDLLESLQELSKWWTVREDILKIITELKWGNNKSEVDKVSANFEDELTSLLDTNIPIDPKVKEPNSDNIKKDSEDIEELNKDDLINWTISRQEVHWEYNYFWKIKDNTFQIYLVKENWLSIFKDDEWNYYFKLSGDKKLFKLGKNIKKLSWEKNSLKLIFQSWKTKIVRLY